MAYTQNPHMPKVRRDAADMVRRGFSPTEVGRRFGVGSSTVSKWVRKAKTYGYHPIPTLSSRPRHHPHELSRETVDAITEKRLLLKRSAEVVHRALTDEGVTVSLSSVKRTLDRNFLLKKRSPWKRYHPHTERPEAAYPGALVEVDTIHLAVNGTTVLYVYTFIDVYSRWTYAWCSARANCRTSLLFVKRAQVAAPFLFECVQTDNGPEFSTNFSERLGIRHRHTRVRHSNDNAHVERFNRTLREECLDALPIDLFVLNRSLTEYLKRYNETRHHFGLNLETPLAVLTKCVQAID
ncbi:DDE-type integrase/transposase/recombinase [Patescibacteria group bacterium]|nr:DDE-type integrase/transposase/recombinase [Patescibacteria group bacterium]